MAMKALQAAFTPPWPSPAAAPLCHGAAVLQKLQKLSSIAACSFKSLGVPKLL